MAGGMVIYKYGADQLDAVFDALSLSPRTIGELGLASMAPDGSTWEDYIGRPVSPKAIELSKIERPLGGASRKPGGCDDDEFLKIRQEEAESCSKSFACSKADTGNDLIIRNKIALGLACLVARNKMMDVCFDGGDVGHRNKATQILEAINNCKGMQPK
jgi:hypothetical protein